MAIGEMSEIKRVNRAAVPKISPAEIASISPRVVSERFMELTARDGAEK